AGYLQIPFVPDAAELTVFCSALVGAGLGFLWFNCHPAQMFMGDTGSLPIGGALGIVAVLIHQPLVLGIAGGVFVMEAGSVLRRNGARVVGVDSGDTADLRDSARHLQPLGVEVALGVSSAPKRNFSLAVVSPAIASNEPLVQEARRNNVPLIGELELGFQQSKCLSIAIAGTNGKGTTGELVERMLVSNQRKTVLTGHRGRPLCDVVE